jgi:hypothetical protein
MDRTGHKSSLMINRYRRAARAAAELHLVDLKPLNEAIPELAAAVEATTDVASTFPAPDVSPALLGLQLPTYTLHCQRPNCLGQLQETNRRVKRRRSLSENMRLVALDFETSRFSASSPTRTRTGTPSRSRVVPAKCGPCRRDV